MDSIGRRWRRHIKTNLLLAVALAGLGPSVTTETAAAGGDERSVLATHALKSLDGTETRLSSFRGDIVVVNFWASWCAPCRKELPVLDQWNTAWRGHGARVIAVSIDEEQRNARRFAEDNHLSLPVIHDGPQGLARALDLPSVPCTYVLDRDGNIVSVIHSGSSADLAALKRQIESMMTSARRTSVQGAGVGTSSVASPEHEIDVAAPTGGERP